jgi:glycosyltransferase involved in cell wall biosynthesis
MNRLALGIICTYFPSRIQPWLVTALEQAMSRGASPVIYAFRADQRDPPEKVNRLGLLRRTCYVQPGTLAGPLRVLARACSRRDPYAADTRHGLARLIGGGHLPLTSPRRAASMLALAPVAGREALDVVHAHSIVPAYYLTAVADALRIPFLFTFHGHTPEGVATLPPHRARSLFSSVARVLVNTRFAESQVAELGCPTDSIVVLPQGLVLDEFPYRPSKYEPGQPVRILSVGRLEPGKGHRYALEAIAILFARGFNLRYRIVGQGSQQTELETLTRELGLSDRVEFCGGLFDEALLAEYAQAHLFLLPSSRERAGWQETQGVVVQEAQASGCIVVATRTGGIPECVDDGRSAFLAPEGDARGLAAAIEQVLRAPDRWSEWQHKGRRWVEERFDAAVIGSRQWEIYLDVLAEHRRGRGASR